MGRNKLEHAHYIRFNVVCSYSQEVLKIVMFNVIVVVSIEFRRTRLEKSCNFICLSSINKVLLLLLLLLLLLSARSIDYRADITV